MLKLTYSNLEFQTFPGEDPRNPLFKGRGGKGKGGEDREGKGKGRREGKDRGGEGQGREVGREGGMGEGRGARHGLAPPLLETSSGSAPPLECGE